MIEYAALVQRKMDSNYSITQPESIFLQLDPIKKSNLVGLPFELWRTFLASRCF
jgi:hypothetical protein